MKVIAVIPAFDECETIARVAYEAKRLVDEVIVVDDGSTDETFNEAQETCVIRHQINRGKGDALRTGFEEALKRHADIIVTLDADGQHDPNEILKLIRPILNDKADLAIGRRDRNSMRLIRRLSNVLCSKILRLFGLDLYDTQCGFRAYSRKTILTLLPQIRSHRYVAETEYLIKAKKAQLSILDTPIATIESSKSNIKPLRDTLQFACFVLGELLTGLRLKAFGK